MANGTVDFYNDTGGYGFIDTEDADEDVFFHMDDVGGRPLEEGQQIEFDIEHAPKGPRATNVVPDSDGRESEAERPSFTVIDVT